MFPLEIFPERSLAESVITTVWVGIFVISFFNLRFGWPFAGLVVPGYLVPLMIAKPTAALVVCLQGFLTYVIVRYSCNRFLSSGMWSSFFGRDRFFALVIVSLAVRLVMDGWILPTIGEFVNRAFNLKFDYRNNLSSFGLIIVALVANQFWKTGLRRGAIPFAVTLGATYVLIRYVLMEYTNFNIGNLEYMYENISASLVASPKAYIILLTCAFVASRMNLLYGWDFNGILIPSLLALEWYHPFTILTTFAETFLILGLACLALRLPVLQQTTVEGARKLVLFFNISFLYKFVLGHIQQTVDTTFLLTDLYGYGYLVPTLIAIKMHDKHVPLILTRATIQTSLTGAILASIVGFSLTFIPPPGLRDLNQLHVQLEPEEDGEKGSLVDRLRMDKLSLYKKTGEGKFAVPLPKEVDGFVQALRSIDRYTRTRSPESLARARGDLMSIGYETRLVDGRYLYIRESGDVRGWGIYVFDLESTGNMVVEIPAPVDEWAVLETGAFLFELLDARAMAVGGSSRKLSRDGSADVLRNGRTLYSVFHRAMGQRSTLQIRGYTETAIDRLRQGLSGEETGDERVKSILWIKKKIPQGLDLLSLKELIGPYSVEWGRTPYRNVQRDETAGGFAELILSRQDRKKLLSLSVLRELKRGSREPIEEKRGHLPDYLLEEGLEVCQRGSNLYVPARVEELLLFDEEIFVPVLGFVQDHRERGTRFEEALNDLEVVEANASIFNYQLVFFRDEISEDDFLILVERKGATDRRYWGTYVFRLGSGRPYCVQVPRPAYEKSSLEYAVSLFSRLDARAFMMSGSHPFANEDGSSDLVNRVNRVNLFNLASQALLRESGPDDLLLVQCRAFGFRKDAPMPEEDILVGLFDGCSRAQCLSRMALPLYDMLEVDNASLRIVGGDLETAGYEAHGSIQAQYVSLCENKELCVLWLSPFFRFSYRQESGDSSQTLKFEVAGLASKEVDLFRYLRDMKLPGRREPCPPALVEDVHRFADTDDVVWLADLDLRGRFARMERVIDVNSRRAFLIGYLDDSAYPVVFNLAIYRKQEAVYLPLGDLSRGAIDGFIRSLAGRLEITEDR